MEVILRFNVLYGKWWYAKLFPNSYIQMSYTLTARKIKFSIKDFFGKYDQIRRKLRIRSQLLKKSLMGNFIFCAVISA